MFLMEYLRGKIKSILDAKSKGMGGVDGKKTQKPCHKKPKES